MFVIHAPFIIQMCLYTTNLILSQLWHIIYRHMSIKGLDTLVKNEIEKGMPNLVDIEESFNDYLVGKQQSDIFLKQIIRELLPN